MQEVWKKFTIPTKNRHRFCGICITDGGYAYTGYEVRKMKKEQESKPIPWEMTDPKPPVIQSGHMEGRVRNEL